MVSLYSFLLWHLLFVSANAGFGKFAFPVARRYKNEARQLVASRSFTLLPPTQLPDTLELHGRYRQFSLALESSNNSAAERGRLDTCLSKLTSAFPFFVLVSAFLGMVFPAGLNWVNNGNLITIMLASVMCGTGLTLRKEDFTNIVQDNLSAVPLGVLCQFIIMPLTAYCVGQTVLLRNSCSSHQALFLGLILVGCSPGGTASNLVSLIANANVALSVILTSCSTVMAVVMTPLLVKLLVAGSQQLQVSGYALVEATARVVLIPVLLGMLINARAPIVAATLSRFTPFASVLLVSLICGGVVAQNATSTLLMGSKAILAVTTTSVLMLHSIGFATGYLVPKLILGKQSNVERTARTISIEVGMQNSALAVVLARSIGAPALACLPGALSATAHSCIGSLLAAYWQRKNENDREIE